jgi:hypothetical protein
MKDIHPGKPVSVSHIAPAMQVVRFWRREISELVTLLQAGRTGVKKSGAAIISYDESTMRAFKVHLNGKRVCVAGVGGDGVLNTSVNYVTGNGRDEFSLTVGGLLSPTEEHVRWVRHFPLKVGDKIALHIIETDLVDIPEDRYPMKARRDDQESRTYVRAIAKKFGWKLVTRPKKST